MPEHGHTIFSTLEPLWKTTFKCTVSLTRAVTLSMSSSLGISFHLQRTSQDSYTFLKRCRENSPETAAPLTRPAPAFAVFPHHTARLQPPAAPRMPSGADLERRPPPASLCLRRAPHPSGPAGSAPAGKGSRRGRDSPFSRNRRSEGAGAPGGARRGWGLRSRAGTRGSGSRAGRWGRLGTERCRGRLSVPRLSRPPSAEAPARPRGAHPATPGAAESPERLRRARTEPRGRRRGAASPGRGSGAGPGTAGARRAAGEGAEPCAAGRAGARAAAGRPHLLRAGRGLRAGLTFRGIAVVSQETAADLTGLSVLLH